MSATPDQLPNDIEEMKRLFLAQAANLEKVSAELAAAKAGLKIYALEIEKLKFQLARLRRQKYGSSSERIEREIQQLELKLEELEAAKAEAEAKAAAAAPATPTATDTPASQPPQAKSKKPRRKFPEHLPRTTVVHPHPHACPTPGCDGTLRTVGEDRTQILEYIPGHFQVREEVRPAGSCNKCGSMVQSPMPELPIPRGQADASLLAHVAIAKYCDHLPLYRQSEIYARDGVDLDRSMLADWMGKTAWLLAPLAEKIEEHVMAGAVIHADDTPVKVLAPGNGKTKTGRFWAYLRDERPHGGSAPPAVVYHYTSDRKGEHCHAHLASFTGHLHADGYAGFGELYRREGAKPGPVIEVGCWSHARRLFFDVHASNGSPIAKEALERIGVLFDIERPIAGKPPDVRQQVRAQLAKPRLDELATWLDQQLQRIPGRSELAKAIRYARSRWVALNRYIQDGRLEISNNAVENAIRPLKLGSKNWLFVGSDSGGVTAARFYTIIRTCMLNGVEPEAYLREVLACIGEFPINRISELLPWNFATRKARSLGTGTSLPL
jgi:transposase